MILLLKYELLAEAVHGLEAIFTQNTFALNGLQCCGRKPCILLLKPELLAQFASALEAFFAKNPACAAP